MAYDIINEYVDRYFHPNDYVYEKIRPRLANAVLMLHHGPNFYKHICDASWLRKKAVTFAIILADKRRYDVAKMSGMLNELEP